MYLILLNYYNNYGYWVNIVILPIQNKIIFIIFPHAFIITDFM